MGRFVTFTRIFILARRALLLGLALCFVAAVPGRTAAADPAQMISDFRLKHGEKRVTLDGTLDANCARSGPGDGDKGRAGP